MIPSWVVWTQAWAWEGGASIKESRAKAYTHVSSRRKNVLIPVYLSFFIIHQKVDNGPFIGTFVRRISSEESKILNRHILKKAPFHLFDIIQFWIYLIKMTGCSFSGVRKEELHSKFFTILLRHEGWRLFWDDSELLRDLARSIIQPWSLVVFLSF